MVYPDAAVSFQRAVNLIEKGTPLRPGEVAEILREYAACLRKLGDKNQARNIEITAAALLSDHPEDPNRGMVVDVTELSQSRQEGAIPGSRAVHRGIDRKVNAQLPAAPILQGPPW